MLLSIVNCMNYEYFKNKSIYSIHSVEELDWLSKNSHINNYVYYGQKIVIDMDLSLSVLKEKFQFFQEIEELFYKYKKDDSFDTLNKLVYMIQKSYVFLYENFDDFDKNMIREFISMYTIVRYIELQYFGQNNITGVSWRLWGEPLVRNHEDDYLKNNPQLFRHAISYAENGMFEEADKMLTKESVQDNYRKHNILDENETIKSNIVISILFYKYKFKKKMGKDTTAVFNDFEKIVDYYKKIDLKMWSLAYLKIAEFYLQHYLSLKKPKST
jgi:hypothetical protein